MDSGFAAFIAISVVVIVAPGQDTALMIRNTLLGGRPAGFATAVGITAGQQVWTLAAALGLTALLIASEPAFMAVRLVGAAYLIWLGMQALWSAIRPGDRSHEPGTRRVASGLSTRTALRQGVISNVSNPKMAILFTSLLPQFVPAESPALGMIGLGLVFSAMGIVWLAGYAIVVARAGDVLRRPRVRRAIDAVMGAILVAFGVRLATEPR